MLLTVFTVFTVVSESFLAFSVLTRLVDDDSCTCNCEFDGMSAFFPGFAFLCGMELRLILNDFVFVKKKGFVVSLFIYLQMLFVLMLW